MAAASGPRPGRLLALTGLLVVGLYAAMFLSGTTTPQLGLDLRGGTQVTLTPRLEPGVAGKITKDNLNTSVNIIRQRVNGLGVAEAEVATEGNNIVISVPGKGRDEVVQLVGQTAQLRFRQVLAAGAATPQVAPSASATPSASAKASPKATKKSSAKPKASSKGRAISQALVAAPTPTPTPALTPAAGAATAATPTPTANPSASATPTSLAQAQAAFANLDCSKPEAVGVDVPNSIILACDRDGTTKYILDKTAVNGTEIKSASAGIPQNSIGAEWEVDLGFKSKGTSQFAAVTQKAAKLPDITQGCQPPQGCNAVAIVLDGVVQSAPRTTDPNGITGGQAQITGNFTEKEARDLANVLKYGALPITFEQQQAVTVSATLGNDQLHAGLLAGAVGLILVVLYSLLYYRGLGIVTIASLALAGLLTYAAVVLLGHAISFTLTLAGIAGLIVAIGITADSFIVYFERLRDEVREGRSLRSAAERGWARAIRTILAADFVSLLAAVVLYLLSIGSVRGFAFTLGLSTLIDLVVVYMFTKPLVTVMVRSKLFGSGKPWTGLSPERLGVRPAAEPARAPRPHRAREA